MKVGDIYKHKDMGDVVEITDIRYSDMLEYEYTDSGFSFYTYKDDFLNEFEPTQSPEESFDPSYGVDFEKLEAGMLTGTWKEALTLKSCDHTWKRYQGFIESYDYCTKCDEKRNKS